MAAVTISIIDILNSSRVTKSDVRRIPSNIDNVELWLYSVSTTGQSVMRGGDFAENYSTQYSTCTLVTTVTSQGRFNRPGRVCSMLEQKKNGGTAQPKTSTNSSNRARRDY